MQLTRNILQEFKKITNRDVEGFFLRSIRFFNGGYNSIVNFYSGFGKPEKGAFEAFQDLERECEELIVLFQNVRSRLNNLKWWELLEAIEAIELRLMTLRKMNKWSRSSLGTFGYDQAIQASYTLKPKQTLERVASDILGKSDSENSWFDIAMSNDLAEEDYTPTGGVSIELKFPSINRGVQVESVVDAMIGKSIYGKDVYRKMQFQDDDLKVLGYDETVQQSVEILSALKKNDNPSAPTSGLQKEVAIGGNRAALNFPIISRQMSEAFATDDSLKNFSITSIELDQDTLKVEFQVETRLSETIDGEVVV